MTTGKISDMSTRFDETSEDLEKYMDWTAPDVANFMKRANLDAYSEVMLKHKISGRLLHLLTDNDLKDMGIRIVGDRLRIKSLINTLGKKHRYDKRKKVWWEGVERLYFSDCGKCVHTCAGICPDDPSTYKLTSNHLKIKTVNPTRIGPFKLPCCNEYSVNNVDLTQIEDVDVIGEPAPCCCRMCCCAPGKGHIEISTESTGAINKGGMIRVTLTSEEAEKASGMIMQNIEECQRMQRQ